MNSSNQSLTAKAYICATPIGNLSDCSHRLLETLSMVSVIAAEDTRVSKKLLGHFKISTPVIRLDDKNEAKAVTTLLKRLQSGEDIAVISDAGTPNICDPGSFLCQKLREASIDLIPIPGPSALTSFLSISGKRTDNFYFGGFFPRESKKAEALLESLPETYLVFFEAPKRILKTLQFLRDSVPISDFFIAKELSKKFEQTWNSLDEIIAYLDAAASIKGEWILGFSVKKTEQTVDLETLMVEFKEQGLSLKQAVYSGQKFLGLKKNQIYKAYHES